MKRKQYMYYHRFTRGDIHDMILEREQLVQRLEELEQQLGVLAERRKKLEDDADALNRAMLLRDLMYSTELRAGLAKVQAATDDAIDAVRDEAEPLKQEFMQKRERMVIIDWHAKHNHWDFYDARVDLYGAD